MGLKNSKNENIVHVFRKQRKQKRHKYVRNASLKAAIVDAMNYDETLEEKKKH